MDTTIDKTCGNISAGVVAQPVPYGLHVLLFLLLLACVISNSTFLLCQCRTLKQDVRLPVYLISWSIGDLVTAALVTTVAIEAVTDRATCQGIWCNVWEVVPAMSLSVPAIHQLALVVERYLAVIYSVLHEIHCTLKKTFVYCVMLWAVILVAIALYVAWNDWALFTEDCLYVFPVCVNKTAILISVYVTGSVVPICLHGKIIYTAVQQERQIHVTTTLTYENFLLEVWLSRVYLAGCVAYLVLWLPFIICCVMCHVSSVLPSNSILYGLFCLGFANASVHGLIYFIAHNIPNRL